jgi:GNAT superfamily N-acetyltransferase
MAVVSAPGPSVVRVGGPPPVRLAEQRDVPRIAATLTLALAESRWARWALPDDGRTQRLTRLHELDAAHRGVATGTAWVAHDVASVAVWHAPDGAPGTHPLPADVGAALARELPRLSDPRWPAVAATAELVAAHRPAGPHWWLAHLATRPSARRQGLGMAVLAPALERCDAAGMPAAAAVHTWAGARFLRHAGFEVTAALQTTDDDHPLWVLARKPTA